MWEVLRHLSHGRLSVRRFSLLIITVLMAFFVATLPAHTAYAEDATRSGDNITYAGKTFAPINNGNNPDKVTIPPQITAQLPDTTGYYYLDKSTNDVYYLMTSGDGTQATIAQYTVYTRTASGTYTNKAPPVAVNIVAGSTTSTAAQGKSTCDSSTLGGIGWMVCPTVNFIAKSMDFIYGIISSFLEVKTVTADISGPVYKLWSIVRDIANVAFVIAFLIIVYSQVTSLGISNYGIKKMLPRLVIAAVALNVSYWICAFAVDASNVLGYSIHNLFMAVFHNLSVGGNYTGDIPTWQQVSAVALAGGGAIAGGVALASAGTGAVFLLIPILVAVALAAIVALTVLAARQALLMCLIIIAPLAIVASILPNTEKYFDKWRSMTLTLLMLFPIFSVIFSGAQLAGMAIIQTSGGNLLTIILGMGVQVAPIVITPLLIKFSTGIIGKVAGMLNNPNKGILDRTRNWAKGAAQERKNKVLADQNRLHKINRVNPFTQATRALDGRRRGKDLRRKAYESMAESNFEATSRGQKMRALSDDANTLKTEVGTRYSRSDVGRAAYYRSQMADIDKDRAHTEFEASHLGHTVDTEKREVDRYKQTIHADHEERWNIRNQTDAGSQEREMKLRIANDSAALNKLKVDTAYSELKLGEIKAVGAIAGRGIVDERTGRPLEAVLAEQAHGIAERSTLTTMRNNNATSELRSKINQEVLNNGAIYQLDARGEKVLGADGKAIIINNRTIEGKTIRDYATGFGKSEITLANAVAEDRSDWGKQAQAAGELISHFKLDSGQVQELATKGTGTIVRVKDDSGNEFGFEAGDEYVKEAAIDKLFKEGSYGQKMAMIKETGAEIREVDPITGAVTVRRGHNYGHRTTVKADAVSSGIASLAPFINDITYNEIIKGNFNGEDSIQMHALRQIVEGRIKVDNLAGANDAALGILANIGKLRSSTDSAEQAQFTHYKDLLFDFFADLYGGRTTPAYLKAVADFDTNFDENFGLTLKSFKQIVENTNLSRSTSAASRKVITKTLDENGISYTS